MVQSWTNNDNLYLKFGTSKITADNSGDYTMYGPNRVAELTINAATYSSIGVTAASSGNAASMTIISDTVLFPPAGSSSSGAGASNSNTWMIEKVEVFTDVSPSAANGTPALNIGLVQWDRLTLASSGYGSALASGVALANLSSGALNTYLFTGSLPSGGAGIGALVGTSPSSANGPYYVTASIASTAASAPFANVGNTRVRIYYHGTGTITQ
jgi:hypothetical protein